MEPLLDSPVSRAVFIRRRDHGKLPRGTRNDDKAQMLLSDGPFEKFFSGDISFLCSSHTSHP